jgi:hypothetical protein
MKKSVLIFLIILITSCTPLSSSPKVTPTNTPIFPTATPSPSLTPTLTHTPQPTPTLTPIPAEEKEAVIQAYRIMLFIQIGANLLKNTATKVVTGELTGFDSFGAIIALSAFVNAVEEAIPQTKVPSIITSYWDQVLPVHTAIKDILSRWVNKEIDSNIVVKEIDPYLKQIEKIMDSMEKKLASSYGFDAKEMNKTREEAIQSMDAIFSTSTPTP